MINNDESLIDLVASKEALILPDNVREELLSELKELEELRTKFAEIEAQEPIGYFYLDSFTENNIFQKAEIVGMESRFAPLYALPVQPSPALEVPDGWKQAWENYVSKFDLFGNEWHDMPLDEIFKQGYMAALSTHTPQSAEPTKPQRITEQDARKVFDAYFKYVDTIGFCNLDNFNEWMDDEGRALLDKLNEQRKPDYKAHSR